MFQGLKAPLLSIVLALLALTAFAETPDASAGASGEAKPNADPPDYAEQAKERVYSEIAPLDEAGFTRMPKPKAGEWLSIHKEPPQTLEKYKLAKRIRPTPDRKTIVLQPLSRDGEIHPDFKTTLTKLRDYAEVYFQLPVRIAEPLKLKLADECKELFRIVPVGNRHGSYDRQFSGDLIMDELLVKKLPVDAMVYLGVTMEDIWTEQSAWVFGLGSFAKRVGVISVARFIPEFWGQPRKDGDDVIALRRACRVMTHETGHMLGLSHCIFYLCEMNGAYSLAEADRTPMHECALCHRKLLWNIGFEPAKRFEALKTFFEQNKLTPEADWMNARLKNWKRLEENAAAPKDE
ncbi:MAG TPA: archaemetzincin [Planctomycetota bacterium]|nr:archaemetzincin [Planctomycetota bacterium]